MALTPRVLRRLTRGARPQKGVRYRKDISGNVTAVSTGFDGLTLEERMSLPSEQTPSEHRGFSIGALPVGLDPAPNRTFTLDPPLPAAPEIEW